jgi:hypothetical protein
MISFDYGAPKFVDPRTVADCPIPIKDEPSPFQSPVSSSFNSGSRPLSPTLNDTHSSEDGHTGLQTHGYTHFEYTYPSVMSSNTGALDSYPQTFQCSPIGNNTAYQPAPKPSPTQQHAIARKQLTSPPSAPTRRRGPGRPSKAQSAAQFPNSKRPTGHSAVKLRRQMHNDSAMRSRARLNKALEELWKVVPKHERAIETEDGGEDNREVCRAVKVEVAINYLKKLQTRLSNSHDTSLDMN